MKATGYVFWRLMLAWSMLSSENLFLAAYGDLWMISIDTFVFRSTFFDTGKTLKCKIVFGKLILPPRKSKTRQLQIFPLFLQRGQQDSPVLTLHNFVGARYSMP